MDRGAQLLRIPATAAPSVGLDHLGSQGARPVRRSAALLATALMLALMAAVLASPLLALWVKALVDPLFHSTSAGASVALLGLLALGCLGLALAPARSSDRVTRHAAVALLVCVLAGNAANLAAHLSLLQAHGLPWTLAVYHWAGDTNTYSYLLHAHTGKVALHALLAGWSGALTGGFDIGGGLAAQVAPGWAWLCLAALAGAVAAYARLLPAVVARWPGWPMPLLFAFCALNSLKTIVDGGPLTYRFAPVLAVLLVMLPALSNLGPRLGRAAALLALVLLAGSGALSLALAGPQAGEALSGLLVTLAVIGALSAWAWHPAAPALRRLRTGATLLCASVIGAALASALIGTPLAMLAPLPDDTQATVCRPPGVDCVRHAVGGQRAFDVYRQAGDDPLKPRHTLLAKPQDDGVSRLLLAVVPLRLQPATPRPAAAVDVQARQALPHGAGVLVEARSNTLPVIFNASAGPFTAANYHVFLHLAAATLRAQGPAEFIMAPVRGDADAQALGLSTARPTAP